MLQNSFLFLGLLIFCFGVILLIKKLLGKAGLYAWIAVASVVSNITAASVGPMLGLHGVTLANVPFATVFLTTQMLSISYGYEEGKKGVYVGLFSSLAFVICMMICSYLIPEPYDMVSTHIKSLFAFGSYNMCNTIASVAMFFLATMLDIWLFNKLNIKLKGKKLWLSKNIATILSSCLENFLFVILGLFLLPNLVFNVFPGSINPSDLMAFGDCLMVALTTCLFECVISFIETPFLYLSKKVVAKDMFTAAEE